MLQIPSASLTHLGDAASGGGDAASGGGGGQTASPPWREMEDWIRNKVKGFHFDQDTVGRVLSSVKHLLRT